MDACFLSIIIPAYNAGKTIARTLESISDLLSPEIEIIVVDDGSTDETSEAIKPFVSRFLQLQSIRQNHSGVSVARNTGISYAQGKYIWFVDADDVVDAKVAKDLLEKIKSADYDFIWFSTVHVFLDNHIEEIGAIPSNVKEGCYTISQWRKFYSGAGMLCQYWLKKNIIKNEKISFVEWAKWFEDAHFLIRFSVSAKMLYIAPLDVIYYYYITPYSAMRGSLLKDRHICNVRLYIDLIKRAMCFQKTVRSFVDGWSAINIAWCLREADNNYARDLYDECKRAGIFPLSINEGTIRQKLQIALLNCDFSLYRKFCKVLRILKR